MQQSTENWKHIKDIIISDISPIFESCLTFCQTRINIETPEYSQQLYPYVIDIDAQVNEEDEVLKHAVTGLSAKLTLHFVTWLKSMCVIDLHSVIQLTLSDTVRSYFTNCPAIKYDSVCAKIFCLRQTK